MAFADFFPVVLIAPFAGAAADRWDKLRVVKISQSLLLVQAAVLLAATASGHINVALIVALTAIHGIVVAFNQPARLALVPSLVPRADLGAAVAINSVSFNLARFIGPIFAGLAIVWSGVAAAFAANALTYVALPGGAHAHSHRAGRRRRDSQRQAASSPISATASAIPRRIRRSARCCCC